MRALPILLCCTLAACGVSEGSGGNTVPPAGSGGTRTYPARDFSAVEVKGPDNVEVRTGGDFSITASGDPALLDRLKVTRDGTTLRIGRESGWSMGKSEGARIVVTMPALSSGAVAGSGNLTVDRAEGDFRGALAGSGDLTVGMLSGGRTAFDIAGSGTIAAAGQVDAVEVSIAGSGDVEAQQLRAQSATVSIAGSGDVRARVEGDATVSLMGSGSVDLGPDARCRVNRMGSGEARCGQTL